MDISSGKRLRTEEKISILLESELSSSIPVPPSNPRTFRKYNQSCIARQCTVTRRFYQCIYHVGNGKELRSIVNHGLIPGGVSPRTGRQAVLFTIENHIDNQDGLWKNPVRLVTSKNRAIQKYTVCCCNLKLVQQRGLHFLSNKIKRSYSLRHTACRVHWESHMLEGQGSALSKGKRDSETACCS